MNEDSVSDVDENTEASNAADLEQPQMELPSNDNNLGPERFPSSADSTESYLQSNKLPKIKQNVRYLPKDSSTWKMATVIPRTWKSTSKHKNFLNLL